MLDKGVQCPITNGLSFSAAINVEVEVDLSAQLDYSFALTGTIIPPKLTEFAIGAGLDFSVDGKLIIDIVATVRCIGTCCSSDLDADLPYRSPSTPA